MPSTKPVSADTKVTDIGSKPTGTLGGTGVADLLEGLEVMEVSDEEQAMSRAVAMSAAGVKDVAR
jgi:hypothetical protein